MCGRFSALQLRPPASLLLAVLDAEPTVLQFAGFADLFFLLPARISARSHHGNRRRTTVDVLSIEISSVRIKRANVLGHQHSTSMHVPCSSVS